MSDALSRLDQSPPGSVSPSQLTGLITAIQQLVRGQSALQVAINNLTTQVGKFSPVFVSVPANSAAAGVAGQMSYDAGFFYICTGAGAWRRVAIAAF